MGKESRLRKTSEFETVRRNGRSWSDRLLVLQALPNDRPVTRTGFSVGKRIGNAVLRNVTKRRLREAVRLMPIQDGWDIVLIARKDATSADFKELNRSVATLCRRARILAGAQPSSAGGS